MYDLDGFAEGGNLIDRSVDTRIGKNQMLWDLGLDEIDDEEMVRRKIENIEEKFDLVIQLDQSKWHERSAATSWVALHMGWQSNVVATINTVMFSFSLFSSPFLTFLGLNLGCLFSV